MPISIRPATTIAELEHLELLITGCWGDDLIEVVSPSLARAIVKSGGIILLAWDAAQPVGFCLSFIGHETVNGQRQLKHHSHMAGVLPAYRDQNIGVQLKQAQADAVAAQGYGLMTWTFDPLETRNGRLNLHKLGTVCNTYHVNAYGYRDDALAAGLATDRFHVHWWLDTRHERHTISTAISLLNETVPRNGLLVPLSFDDGLFGTDALAVAVPRDFQALKSADLPLAVAWREHTRAVFQSAFDAGYTAVDLVPHADHCHYILTK